MAQVSDQKLEGCGLRLVVVLSVLSDFGSVRPS